MKFIKLERKLRKQRKINKDLKKQIEEMKNHNSKLVDDIKELKESMNFLSEQNAMFKSKLRKK